MQMIRWREENAVSLGDMAQLLGMKASARGMLSRIERGEYIAAPEVLDRIYWVTFYIGPEPVRLEDHVTRWRRSHPQESTAVRAESRAAVTAFNRAVKKPKEGDNGRTRKRQG